MKNHPLRDIAQRCAGISTSEDKGHIYVALLKVDRQWKHYVGKADNLWEDRWKKEGQYHEKLIESALEKLLADPPNLTTLESSQCSHIEMAKAILEFKLERQKAPAIVVYKVQCSLVRTAGLECTKSYEQHFINAFSDTSDTEELNSMAADKSHLKGKCSFSEDNIACKNFLDKCLRILEGHWAQRSEFEWFHIQDDASNEDLHRKHPLQQTVQKAARNSESDSSTGAQAVHVYIALISIANTYKHSIHVTKDPCTTETIDQLKGLLQGSDAKNCLVFNHMCHPDKQCALELLSVIHRAAEPRATPKVSLYTVATVEGTPVANDHDMRSVQQHFMNALDGLMEGGRSTLVNPPEGDIIHSGDEHICPFSLNGQLSCSVHLTKALEQKSDWSLKFNEDRRTYDCVYEVLTHQ